jgi:hypothetical protein
MNEYARGILRAIVFREVINKKDSMGDVQEVGVDE